MITPGNIVSDIIRTCGFVLEVELNFGTELDRKHCELTHCLKLKLFVGLVEGKGLLVSNYCNFYAPQQFYRKPTR
jgi:hypothetical protein